MERRKKGTPKKNIEKPQYKNLILGSRYARTGSHVSIDYGADPFWWRNGHLQSTGHLLRKYTNHEMPPSCQFTLVALWDTKWASKHYIMYMIYGTCILNSLEIPPMTDILIEIYILDEMNYQPQPASRIWATGMEASVWAYPNTVLARECPLQLRLGCSQCLANGKTQRHPQWKIYV